jgi:hypothetical protein
VIEEAEKESSRGSEYSERAYQIPDII